MVPQSSQMLPRRSPRGSPEVPNGTQELPKVSQGSLRDPQRHPRAPKLTPRGRPEAPFGIPGVHLGDVLDNTTKKATKIMNMLILHRFFIVFEDPRRPPRGPQEIPNGSPEVPKVSQGSLRAPPEAPQRSQMVPQRSPRGNIWHLWGSLGRCLGHRLEKGTTNHENVDFAFVFQCQNDPTMP